MKSLNRRNLQILMGFLIFAIACSEEDQQPEILPTGQFKTYVIKPVTNPAITGNITFHENSSSSTTIEIILQNTSENILYPAHIRFNSAAETGEVALTLNPIDGFNGSSNTTVTQLDNGTLIEYNDFLDFDGYLNVNLSSEVFETIIGQADIGSNELTGESVTYPLISVDIPTVSGLATFEERKNGEALATIKLENTAVNDLHPAHIHNNSVEEGGEKIFQFNPIDGEWGLSTTNISEQINGDPLLYAHLISLDGHIKVHQSVDDLETVIAKGNIGSNAGNDSNIITYEITNMGASAYVFNGNGLTDASNPALALTKGLTYIFKINAAGHPFYIKETQGSGTSNVFENGVTNNGTDSGDITFTVPANAPSGLFYNCQFHAVMTNSISISN